jgi:hypothetical protein
VIDVDEVGELIRIERVLVGEQPPVPRVLGDEVDIAAQRYGRRLRDPRGGLA